MSSADHASLRCGFASPILRDGRLHTSMFEIVILVSVFLLALVATVIFIAAYYWGPKGGPRR